MEKYILTKYETVRRIEKVEYEVGIPKSIRDKAQYAGNKIAEGNYEKCRVIDIVDSELIDEEFAGIKRCLAHPLRGY